ncbi:MAG TPA: hypothetical protein VGO37_06790 [Steroidobacteraceae bacterium]|jgi:hypothetical protein|nr:hypothetical protein [Steroidobacteraceae bacterium]
MSATPAAPYPRLHEGFFALFGGPIAWFLHLCAGYALANEPCWRAGQRIAHSPLALEGSRAGIAGATIAAVLVALGATSLSWRAYKKAREAASAHGGVDPAVGRAAFLSLWGVILGGGSAVAASLTAIALNILPRCGG